MNQLHDESLAETIIQELLEGVPQTYKTYPEVALRGYIQGTHLQLYAEYEYGLWYMAVRDLRIDLSDPTSIDTAQNWLTKIFKRKYSSTPRPTKRRKIPHKKTIRNIPSEVKTPENIPHSISEISKNI